MKRIQSLLVVGLAIALAGVTTFSFAEAASRQSKATVKGIQGDVSYQVSNGQWMPLHVNADLPEGAVIKVGADSFAYLQVNGRTSTVRVAADTQLTLKTMEVTGHGADATTETMLDLANGNVLGSVKKISADSHYDVTTPKGVAGVRGTDFQVSVTLLANGNVRVTFTSVTGEVFCSGIVTPGSAPVTKTLHDGEQWTVGEDVIKVDVAYLVKLIITFPVGTTITVTVTPPPTSHPTGSTVGGNAETAGTTPTPSGP